MQLMELPSIPDFCLYSQKDSKKDYSFQLLCKEAIASSTERLAEHVNAVELRKMDGWMFTCGEISYMLIMAANLG